MSQVNDKKNAKNLNCFHVSIKVSFHKPVNLAERNKEHCYDE